MIYDCFRVTGAHDTVLDNADLFSITLRDDDVDNIDMRWDEILLSMTKIPPDDILERLYKMRTRESDQFKNRIRILRHGNSSEDIKAWLTDVENDGEEKHKSETQISKHWRQKW